MARVTGVTEARRPPPAGLTMSEDDLKAAVLELAMLRGWMVCHVRPARSAKGWRTPIEGHKGLPDLILARGGRVILAELKGPKGRPTPGQRDWLAAAGPNGRLWNGNDWDAIAAELSTPPAAG